MMLKLNNKYNNMLILFLILLGLLTLTSAIGGGIKLQENFWEDIEISQEEDEEEQEETQSTVNVPEPILENPGDPQPPASLNIPNRPVPVIDNSIEGFEGNMYAGCA